MHLRRKVVARVKIIITEWTWVVSLYYRGVIGYNFPWQNIAFISLKISQCRHYKNAALCAISLESSVFFQKILINESLEYKGLMLIPMAGVFVSRLSLYSFEELWRPEMRKHLRCEALEKYPNCCIRSSENHAHTLHPSLTFLLDDHSSIQLLVASLLPQTLNHGRIYYMDWKHQ